MAGPGHNRPQLSRQRWGPRAMASIYLCTWSQPVRGQLPRRSAVRELKWTGWVRGTPVGQGYHVFPSDEQSGLLPTSHTSLDRPAPGLLGWPPQSSGHLIDRCPCPTALCVGNTQADQLRRPTLLHSSPGDTPSPPLPPFFFTLRDTVVCKTCGQPTSREPPPQLPGAHGLPRSWPEGQGQHVQEDEAPVNPLPVHSSPQAEPSGWCGCGPVPTKLEEGLGVCVVSERPEPLAAEAREACGIQEVRPEPGAGPP